MSRSSREGRVALLHYVHGAIEVTAVCRYVEAVEHSTNICLVKVVSVSLRAFHDDRACPYNS